MKNDISLVIPYYNTPNMVSLQLDYWNSYSDDIKKNLKIIIVDDGSKDDQKINNLLPKDTGLNIEIYEIIIDIPWNECGANNLGLTVATSKWVFRNDIDWLIPKDTMEAVCNADLDPNCHYQFLSRYWNTGEKIGIPPNIILLTKELFWKSGGYDEDFRGHHGSDMLFKRRLLSISNVITFPTYYMEAVLAGSTHTLVRDATESFKLLDKKLKGAVPVSKDYLRFEWKRVR